MIAVGTIGRLRVGLGTGRAVSGFVLDRIGAASAAAFGTRRLRTNYLGAALRVRRSSDNAEQDIGFNPVGNLDTAALIAHCPANYLLQSETYAAAGWTRSNVTVAGKTITSTAGGATASGMSQVVTTPVGNTAYTLDIMTSGTTSPWLRIAVTDGGVTPQSWVNLSTGAVGTVQAGITLSSSPIAGGYRLTLVRTVASASTTFFIRLADTDNSINSPAIGSTLTIDRALVNSGTTAGAYIATTTATIINSGFVATWHDQSGNARNATQASAALQPRIVNAGVVETFNGRPSLVFSGAQVLVISSMTMIGATPNAVVQFTTAPTTTQEIMRQNASSGPEWALRADVGGIFRFYRLPVTSLTAPAGAGATVVTGIATNGANSQIFTNGVAAASSTAMSLTATTGPMGIGGSPAAASFLAGRILELSVFGSPLSTADRQTLERNQGAFFGVTVA